MRLLFSALPWQLLGLRPVFITLTYPADWRACCPDADTLVRHREAFKEAWRKAFGTPVGVWVVEFQRRGAPHLHLYLRLPDTVSESEFRSYVRRTIRRRRLEEEYGKYEGRRRMRAPEGEFAGWLLTTWFGIVGSDDWNHRYRGVDVAAVYFTEKDAIEANREQVADYFWRESGKWSQKRPPEGFGTLRMYGVWGRRAGFVPSATTVDLDKAEFVVLRRLYRRYLEAKIRGEQHRRWRWQGRGLDGITLYGLRDAPQLGVRAQRWAESEALQRRVRTGGSDAR